MKRSLVMIAALIVAMAEGSAASGAILSISEFSGEFNESFENAPYGDVIGPADQVSLSGQMPILGGRGVLSGRHAFDLRPLFIWSSNDLSLDDLTQQEGHVVAIVRDGENALTLQSVLGVNPIGRIDFLQPVSRFGGYWLHAVTRDEAGPITIKFFDAAESLIGESQVHYDYARLQGISQWFGWRSDQPVYAVEFTGFWASVDAMQMSVVPEPQSSFLLSTGVVLLSVCRRLLRGGRKSLMDLEQVVR